MINYKLVNEFNETIQKDENYDEKVCRTDSLGSMSRSHYQVIKVKSCFLLKGLLHYFYTFSINIPD